jgi:hypothetical protein
LGLDVHAETIAVAVAEPEGEVRSLGTIPNRAESIRKLIKKLGPAEKLRACYEAGPTGYIVYWQLAPNRYRSRMELSSTSMYLVRIAQTAGEHLMAAFRCNGCQHKHQPTRLRI